ncbi:MAG: DoxX family protein [Chloroflexota bacterium]
MDFVQIGLWIVQGLVGLAFLGAGFMKLTQPEEKLIDNGMTFIEDIGINATRGIGLLEVLGGLGILLPVPLNILPVLTPLAALGLMIVMVGALLTHLRRGETSSVVPNVVLGALVTIVFFAYNTHLGELLGL